MPEHNGLIVETVVNGPFMENCHIVLDPGTRRAILVDPGDEEDRILDRVRELGLSIAEVVCTHAHIDHAGAVAAIKRGLGHSARFALHAAERPALEFLPRQAMAFGLGPRAIPDVDRELADGDTVEVGALRARVLFTPGHSAGGICLYFEEQRVVFVGDTLFAGSVGRTDLPGGSTRTLLASIRDRLLTLDDAVVVYCGHGPPTTIGEERASNPFLQEDGGLLF